MTRCLRAPGVRGDLALHALALGLQEIAYRLQFRDQVIDLLFRGAGHARDQGM